MWQIIALLVVFGEVIPKVFGNFEECSIFEDDDIYGKPIEVAANETEQPSTMIFPGTKWCGPGNRARSLTDLGKYRATDGCCREHDNCEELIMPKSEKYGLENPDRYVRLQCECEQKFINCLKRSNTMVSWLIGKIYYVTRGTCYKLEHPVVECTEHQRGYITRRKRCIKYKVDRDQPQAWQWFDMPYFCH